VEIRQSTHNHSNKTKITLLGYRKMTEKLPNGNLGKDAKMEWAMEEHH
jgi:hypothetical protein